MVRRATTRSRPVADPALWPSGRAPGAADRAQTRPASRADTASETGADTGSVMIDCDTCVVRGPGCPDCVVTVLLGIPAPRLRIEQSSVQALEVLARSGLVPPLRHDQAG